MGTDNQQRGPVNSEQLSRLCSEDISDHVLKELCLVSDSFSEMMLTPLMSAVLLKHRAHLKQIFNAYAAADTSSSHSRKALATMDILEVHMLCEEVM